VQCILVAVRDSVNRANAEAGRQGSATLAWRPWLAAVVGTALLAGAIAVGMKSPHLVSGEAASSGDRIPTSIDVIPHVESVLERGEAQQFRAIVRSHHEVLDEVKVTWSANPRVGTIDQNGLFVATTACLKWDGIGLVVATLDTGLPGRRPLSDGDLVAVHHDPRCLPDAPTFVTTRPGG
jgi:hypothetical protein